MLKVRANDGKCSLILAQEKQTCTCNAVAPNQFGIISIWKYVMRWSGKV